MLRSKNIMTFLLKYVCKFSTSMLAFVCIRCCASHNKRSHLEYLGTVCNARFISRLFCINKYVKFSTFMQFLCTFGAVHLVTRGLISSTMKHDVINSLSGEHCHNHYPLHRTLENKCTNFKRVIFLH